MRFPFRFVFDLMNVWAGEVRINGGDGIQSEDTREYETAHHCNAQRGAATRSGAQR